MDILTSQGVSSGKQRGKVSDIQVALGGETSRVANCPYPLYQVEGEEMKRCKKCYHIAEKNPMWKGDKDGLFNKFTAT